MTLGLVGAFQPGEGGDEGRLGLFVILDDGVALAKEVGRASLPDCVGGKRRDLFEDAGGLLVLLQLEIRKASLVETTGHLVGGRLGFGEPYSPCLDLGPFLLAETDITDGSEGGDLVGGVL